MLAIVCNETPFLGGRYMEVLTRAFTHFVQLSLPSFCFDRCSLKLIAMVFGFLTLLIRIMRRKTNELNEALGTSDWTPRRVDMVLWTCVR